MVLLFIRFNIMELLNKLLDLFITTIEPISPGRKCPGFLPLL